jgi:hypothetical protein
MWDFGSNNPKVFKPWLSQAKAQKQAAHFGQAGQNSYYWKCVHIKNTLSP